MSNAAAIQLRKRSDIHWPRKIWHMGMVSVMLCFYIFAPIQVSMGLLALFWVLFVSVDVARQKNQNLNVWITKYFRVFMRDTELNGYAGTTFLLSGTAIIILLFPREVVTVTLAFLAFADPLASFVGLRYGKVKILGQKSLEGFMAAMVVCFFISIGYLLILKVPTHQIMIISLISALIGALAELIPIGKLDDNLSLQVVSATGIYFTYLWLGTGIV